MRERLCHLAGTTCAVGLLVLAGCAPDRYGAGLANDPLVGGPPLRAPGSATAGAATTPAAGGVPDLPSPSPPGSTAALAAGKGLTSLDASRDLRIGTPTGNPRGGGTTWTGTTPAVALEGPQPLSQGAPAKVEQPRPSADFQLTGVAGNGGAAPNYEQLRAKLVERGLVWIRWESSVEKGTGSLTCFVASRQNPGDIQRFEMTARDEISALKAVLEKIDGGR